MYQIGKLFFQKKNSTETCFDLNQFNFLSFKVFGYLKKEMH